MTSSADLFLMGIQNVKPVNIQTAVNAYLLPLEEGGVKFTNEIDADELHWLHTWFEYLLFKLCFLDFFALHM